jgi:aminodeoxyfutalosine deaminase
MPLYTADWILAPEGLRQHRTLELNDAGTVVALHDSVLPGAQHQPGILTPGWINAHCHLELSHLAGIIPPGVGMAGFIAQLQHVRNAPSADDQQAAALAALHTLRAQGVVAVGDISNGTTSFPAKLATPDVYVHTFVECLGLNPASADAALAKALAVYAQAPGAKSLTPHAPYSVSAPLFALLAEHQRAHSYPLSYHLLESEDELAYFSKADGGGPLSTLFQSWGISATAPGAQPASTLLDNPPAGRLGLVHLTQATAADLAQLALLPVDPYFILCPRANQYLHGTLPDLGLLHPADPRICMGTDSLAGNYSFNLAQELFVLQQHWPHCTLEHLLRMVTSNGARFLGQQDTLGAFRPGTTPGVVWLRDIPPGTPRLTEASTTRLLHAVGFDL